jgi:hypothetical protein
MTADRQTAKLVAITMGRKKRGGATGRLVASGCVKA